MNSYDFDPEPDWDAELFKTDPHAMLRKMYDWRNRETERTRTFDPELHWKPLSYDEKKGPAIPKMEQTISLVKPDLWSLGSTIVCEKIEVGFDAPVDIVCQWVDDGSTYCLRKRSKPKTDRTTEGDPTVGRVYESTCTGLWTLSPNVFCKVRWWDEESTTDATNVRFVNRHFPTIPTEELIYDWIDREWGQSFMLTRRAPGTRYDKAWPLLTEEQKLGVAAQVAKHEKTLSELTSDYLETVTERGIEGEHSLRLREDLPQWRPRVEPKVSRDEYRKYLRRIDDGLEPPDFGERFVLMHPNPCPMNIFVTTPSDSNEIPRVTAIINWTDMGYRPKFALATFVRGRYQFAVESQPEGWDWMWMLSNALVAEGFPLEMEYLKRHAHPMLICEHNLPK